MYTSACGGVEECIRNEAKIPSIYYRLILNKAILALSDGRRTRQHNLATSSWSDPYTTRVFPTVQGGFGSTLPWNQADFLGRIPSFAPGSLGNSRKALDEPCPSPLVTLTRPSTSQAWLERMSFHIAATAKSPSSDKSLVWDLHRVNNWSKGKITNNILYVSLI